MSAPAPGRRALLGGAAALLGATGLPLPAEAAPDPDAEIVAACARYLTVEAEWLRRLALDEDADDGALIQAVRAVADLPAATTMAGVRAKARAVLVYYGADLSEDCALSPTLREVLHAVAGVPVSGVRS